MMNINEPLIPSGIPARKLRTGSFRPSLFLCGKAAHARKSGIGKGEKGCGCEGRTAHGGDLT